ncbi:hypothetical protein [uncultured Paludibaculum sp.]|uniref:hypothetical protein n=1 Tax=uncultured Paludibaculum sp. TaxID=1765020 RepID=UPI002AAB6DBE|nr:hypothetical protein [uncultured Paludibaculum sp.]
MASQAKSSSQKIERIQNAVRQLPAASAHLNTATDQLGRSVGQIDTVLKKFSLGVPTWVSFNTDNSLTSDFYSEQIGYAKIGGKWGIAIRIVSGNYQDPDGESVEQWLFNDAPRLLRVHAVDTIPELLEDLLKKSEEMTRKITEKADEVDAFAAAIDSVIEPVSNAKPGKR